MNIPDSNWEGRVITTQKSLGFKGAYDYNTGYSIQHPNPTKRTKRKYISKFQRILRMTYTSYVREKVPFILNEFLRQNNNKFNDNVDATLLDTVSLLFSTSFTFSIALYQLDYPFEYSGVFGSLFAKYDTNYIKFLEVFMINL